jgi:hypothetical protein
MPKSRSFVGKAMKSRGIVAERDRKHGPMLLFYGFTSAFLFTTTHLFTPREVIPAFTAAGMGSAWLRI